MVKDRRYPNLHLNQNPFQNFEKDNINKYKMNNHTNKQKNVCLLYTILCICIVPLLVSCTNQTTSNGNEIDVPTSVEALNISVKYAEAYDQTTITFSRYWPPSISQGLNKTVDKDGEIMVDYERVKEVVAFDEQGYMASSIEFLEGDQSMNMPEEIYKSLKEYMPAEGVNHDPIVKQEMSNGVIKKYGVSGNIVYEDTYDPEEYKIDPATLDSLQAYLNAQDSTNSINSNLEQLNAEGINFSREGDYIVKYSLFENNGNNTENGIRYEYLDDLRNGTNLQTSIYNSEGKLEEVWLNTYANVKGYPILSARTELKYAMVDDNWQVAYRTLITRENIQLIKN